MQDTSQGLERDIHLTRQMCSELEADNSSLQQSIELLKDNLKTHGQCEELLFKKDEVMKGNVAEVESVKVLLEEVKESCARREKSCVEQVGKLSEQVLLLRKGKSELEAERDRMLIPSRIELASGKLSLEGKITGYEQLICCNEDLHALADSQRERLEFLQGEKARLEISLSAALKQAEATEKTNHELKKKVNSLLLVVNGQGESLEFTRTELNTSKQFVYVPVEGDVIDVRLAEDLNGLPDPRPLAKLFVRESRGIYNFGTKKIFVKLENNKIMSKSSS